MKKINIGLFCIVLLTVLTTCRTTTPAKQNVEKRPLAEISIKVVTDKGRAHANKAAGKLCAVEQVQKRKKFIESVCLRSDCKRKAYRYSCIK